MSEAHRTNPRLDEDLKLESVAGGPPRYRRDTQGPVQYLAIADPRDAVIGYVWANDADDAAGWLLRAAAGDDAFNEGFVWATKLHDAKARGVSPTAALTTMIRDSDTVGTSHVVPGSSTEAPSLTMVKDLARQA